MVVRDGYRETRDQWAKFEQHVSSVHPYLSEILYPGRTGVIFYLI